jgi:hypothetical protein
MAQDSRMAVIETQGIALQADTFVRRIKQYREEIRPIVTEMRHMHVPIDYRVETYVRTYR